MLMRAYSLWIREKLINLSPMLGELRVVLKILRLLVPSPEHGPVVIACNLGGDAPAGDVDVGPEDVEEHAREDLPDLPALEMKMNSGMHGLAQTYQASNINKNFNRKFFVEGDELVDDKRVRARRHLVVTEHAGECLQKWTLTEQGFDVQSPLYNSVLEHARMAARKLTPITRMQCANGIPGPPR